MKVLGSIYFPARLKMVFMRNRKTKLIIDADPGIGDALAIVVAALDPEIDLLAVTACAGVVSGEQANRNLQTIFNRLDLAKYPRIGFCDEDSEDVIPTLQDIPAAILHGENGLGDCPVTAAPRATPKQSTKVLLETVRSYPGEVTLLTLGPLTNIKSAAESSPGLLQDLGNLICLGGAITYGGNITAAAEGNFYADAQAAQSVMESSAHKILVPLDVSSQLFLNYSELDRLPRADDSTISQLLDQLLPFSLRVSRRHLGQEGVPLNEIAALCAVSRPQIFSRRLMSMEVETQGKLTRGMTVFDQRNLRNQDSNIEVVTEIDTRAAVDYFTGVLWNALESELQ